MTIQRGAARWNARFTDHEVSLIFGLIAERERLRMAASELTNQKIAEKFECHIRTIDAISAKKTWFHITTLEKT